MNKLLFFGDNIFTSKLNNNNNNNQNIQLVGTIY